MEKRFVYFSTKAKFTAATQGTEYDFTSIVFIADSKEIWNRGVFYATPNNFDIADYLTKAEAESTYLKEHQSLANYYNKGEVDALIEGIDVTDQLEDYVLETALLETLKSYALKTEIPTDFYSKEEVDGAIESAKTAVKSEIIGGAGQDYDTLKEIETWVKSHQGLYENLVANNATKSYVDGEIEKLNIDQYAKSEDVTKEIGTATNDMATQTWVEGKKYLTEHQSLEGLAKTSEVESKISDATNDMATMTWVKSQNYATQSFVSEKVTEIVTGGEIELTGYAKSEDVTKEIGTAIAGLSATYYTKSEIDDMFEWGEY